jgi:hypothetical protein
VNVTPIKIPTGLLEYFCNNSKTYTGMERNKAILKKLMKLEGSYYPKLTFLKS